MCNNIRSVPSQVLIITRWISELEKIRARANGENFMDMLVNLSLSNQTLTTSRTDTPTLGMTTFMLPSVASVKYCKVFKCVILYLQLIERLSAYPAAGNYTKPIKTIFKSLSTDSMKHFLIKFSR